jgi:hypothetical protein
MCGNIVCVAAVLLGVDARWPSLPGGGLQYVIQIEPCALDPRQSDTRESILSYVPPYLSDIRAYQIVMGTQKSARNLPTANVHSSISRGVETDWVSSPAGDAECHVWIKPEVLDELAQPGRVIEGKIPIDVDRPTIFRIAIGTKPPVTKRPVLEPPVTEPPVTEPAEMIEAQPSPAVAAEVNEFPDTLLTPALPPERSAPRPPWPRVVPQTFDWPSQSKALTTLNRARLPSPFPMMLPNPQADPSALDPNVSGAQPATHMEPSPGTPDDTPQAKTKSNLPTNDRPSPKEPPTPWPTRDVTLLGLLASFSGNVFLLWFVWNFHSRHLLLVKQLGEVNETATDRASDMDRDT